MFLFEAVRPKGKNREARPGGKVRQDFYRREVQFSAFSSDFGLLHCELKSCENMKQLNVLKRYPL